MSTTKTRRQASSSDREFRCTGIAATLALCLTVLNVWRADAGRIHSVTDIGHEFSFYSDGRFFTQYLQGDGNRDARNWGTLHKCDLSNVNLLVLISGTTPCPYTEQDIAAVRALLNEGGGVVVLGNFGLFRKQTDYQLNALARAFGAEFTSRPASRPLRATPSLTATTIDTYGGNVIRLTTPELWTVLVRDADDEPVLARRAVAKGSLLLGNRDLFGRQPDAGDPINAAWIKPLLRDIAGGKHVDPDKPSRGQWFDLHETRDGLSLHYSEYTKQEADTILDLYAKCMPVLGKIFGVPPSKGTLTGLLLLPTGGGGFSSGRDIGLGIWWGDFPNTLYPMIELIGHEGTHSWVLPFGEPMWNESMATYIGGLTASSLGCPEEARRMINRNIAAARRKDPEMNRYDIAYGKDVPRDVQWGKAMWIWEELRKQEPDAIARYFRAKRKLATPGILKSYTPDDCVAVLSHAMERDMFPWFQAHGLSVNRDRATIRFPAE